jgi:hypothetical protein
MMDLTIWQVLSSIAVGAVALAALTAVMSAIAWVVRRYFDKIVIGFFLLFIVAASLGSAFVIGIWILGYL